MPNSLADWVGLIAAAVMILCGGGGIGAFMKQRHDQKSGVRQENRADNDSLNARTLALLEIQYNFLVKPMEEKLGQMQSEVSALSAEVKMSRVLYQSAIEHIRTLYAWIVRHVPNDIQENTEVPKPPSELVNDLNLHE